MGKCTMKSTKGFSNVTPQVKFINFEQQVAVFEALAKKDEKPAEVPQTAVKEAAPEAEKAAPKKAAPEAEKAAPKKAAPKAEKAAPKKAAKKPAAKKAKKS